MIVADVLGPWHDITDGEGNPDVRRLPQFLHDVGDMPIRDVTAQASEQIPPTPGLAVWRVWCTSEQLARFVELSAYEVLRSAEVEITTENSTPDPEGWPQRAATPGDGVAAFPALPDSGWLEAGAMYLHDGSAWIVRQSHNRTEHDPADVPALFMVYRADATDVLAWIAGEQVYVGTQRTYGGVTYTCLIAHVTQADWTPDATHALWQPVVEPTSEWAAGVSYKVGDEVMYEGREYECLQAHTAQPGWTPAAVPALWRAL